MNVRLYIDEDAMSHALVGALRARGANVLTPLDAGTIATSDEQQLRRATADSRAIYSFNAPHFCAIHAEFLQRSEPHGGIIVARQRSRTIGDQMRSLLRLISTLTADDMRNRLEFLAAWTGPETGSK